MTAAARDATDPAELAGRIAAAALDVDSVAGLHAGRFGEVATYLPGQRITGVRVGETIEVHIVVDTALLPRATAVTAIGDEVRARAEQLAGRPVTVVVADILIGQKS